MIQAGDWGPTLATLVLMREPILVGKLTNVAHRAYGIERLSTPRRDLLRYWRGIEPCTTLKRDRQPSNSVRRMQGYVLSPPRLVYAHIMQGEGPRNSQV